MAIATVPAVATIPTEGSPTFRIDAENAWNELKNFSVALKDITIPQMNTSIQSVNNNTAQVANDKSTTLTAKDTAVSARNRAENAANRAEAVVIPTEATYNLEAIETSLNGLLTNSVAQTAQISILTQGL